MARRTEKLHSISTAALLAAAGLLVVVALWPAPAEAQVFGRGARTEFISGFGIRTFASLLKFNDLLADGSNIDDPAQRSVSVRVTPVSLVYGWRRSVSVVGIFPFVDKAMTVTGADGPTTIGSGHDSSLDCESRVLLLRLDCGNRVCACNAYGPPN